MMNDTYLPYNNNTKNNTNNQKKKKKKNKKDTGNGTFLYVNFIRFPLFKKFNSIVSTVYIYVLKYK